MNRDQVVRSTYLAGRVKRYHTWPVLHQENVAEHTFNVLRIYVRLFGAPRAAVTEAIVNHDLPEIRTGDIPFPMKRRVPELKALMDELEDEHAVMMGINLHRDDLNAVEKFRIKLCDIISQWEFGAAELAMGNKLAGPIFDDTAKVIDEMIKGSEQLIMNVREYQRDTVEALEG